MIYAYALRAGAQAEQCGIVVVMVHAERTDEEVAWQAHMWEVSLSLEGAVEVRPAKGGPWQLGRLADVSHVGLWLIAQGQDGIPGEPWGRVKVADLDLQGGTGLILLPKGSTRAAGTTHFASYCAS